MDLGDDEGLNLESSVAQAFARILAILDTSYQTRENDHESYIQAFGRVIAILQTLDSVRGNDKEKYTQAFAKSNQALEMLGMLWDQLSSKMETQDESLGAMQQTIQEKDASLERFQNDVRQQHDRDRDTLIQQLESNLERSRIASREEGQQECELIRNEAREARRELESTRGEMSQLVDRILVVADDEVQSMKRTIDARACTKETAAALAANLAAEQDRIKAIIDARVYTRDDATTLINQLDRAFSGQLASGLSRAIDDVDGRLKENSRRSSNRLDRLSGNLAWRDKRCEEHARKAKRTWDEVFSRSGEENTLAATPPDQVLHHHQEGQEVLYPDLRPALRRARTTVAQAAAVPERPSSRRRRRVSDRPQIHLVIPVTETTAAAPVDNLDTPPETIPTAAAVHNPGDMDGTDTNDYHLDTIDHPNAVELPVPDIIDSANDLDHLATINNSPNPLDNPDIIEISSSGSYDSGNSGNSPNPADDFPSPFYHHQRNSAPSSPSSSPPPAPRRRSSVMLSPVHAGLRRCWHRLSGGFCAELSYRSDGEEELAVRWRCAYHRALGVWLGRV
ncbi:MAG: hypothetical protein LQ346_006992 [Caloplaca aetnensis]|nr:MAG: hypothetical protein LQ346_006992 [Caloplaca aetnensis]